MSWPTTHLTAIDIITIDAQLENVHGTQKVASPRQLTINLFDAV